MVNEIIDDKILAFKNREIKAKHIFGIKEITKGEAYQFVKDYHYLKEAKFFAKFAYGLFIDGILVGCATYSNPQGIVAMKSWFGLENDNQDVLELSRLCMLPTLNNSNATSYLLGNSLKMLKNHDVKAVITLADASRHVGSIYQICNFKYYGLTNKKTDFYTFDGKVNPRGETKHIRGVWLPRTQKHSYCYILDKDLICLLKEEIRPTLDNVNEYGCCDGSNKVYDKRFNQWYSCPKCCESITILADDHENLLENLTS
jgi:hypothetical protein